MLKQTIFLITMLAVLSAARPPGKTPTSVIFVNCAESQTDSKGHALTLIGQEQAGHLVKFLKDEPVAAVYSTYNACLVQTVTPLADEKGCKVVYFRDACNDNPDVMRHILDVMMEKNEGKTIVICAPAKSIVTMAGMLGIRPKDLRYSTGNFNEVLIVNVLGSGEAVAQKLNMIFQKKV